MKIKGGEGEGDDERDEPVSEKENEGSVLSIN